MEPETITQSSFGAWLKKAYKAKDLIAIDVAEASGYSVGTVRAITSGRDLPSMTSMINLAAAIGYKITITAEEDETYATD